MIENFFHWKIFLQDTGGGETYFEWLLSAWKWTLAVSFFSWIVALITGSIAGVMRTLPSTPIKFLGEAWTEIFRNIPLLVQIFIWYHVIPSLFFSLKDVPPTVLVIIGLGFFTSARISELVKAGIDSIPRGQFQASMALGLTRPQAYAFVIFPQTMRVIIPPLTSESMSIVKNSSVAFAVSVSELTMFALQAGEETAKSIEMFLATTILYFISAYAVSKLFQLFEKKMRIPGFHGGKR